MNHAIRAAIPFALASLAACATRPAGEPAAPLPPSALDPRFEAAAGAIKVTVRDRFRLFAPPPGGTRDEAALAAVRRTLDGLAAAPTIA